MDDVLQVQIRREASGTNTKRVGCFTPVLTDKFFAHLFKTPLVAVVLVDLIPA